MKRSFSITFTALGLFLFTSCGGSKEVDAFDNHTMDTHSYAKPAQARTSHLDLNLDIDFEARIISGTARHILENNGATEFILDTRGLTILQVTLDDSDLSVTHRITEEREYLGSALVVPIDPST